MSNLLLNLDDFVRVTQTTGDYLTGRYDGVDYVFPDGEPVDCHKAVATHIFGFGLPEESTDPRVQDKTSALMRLGWLSVSGERKAAIDTLRRCVKFDEIPPFTSTLRLQRPEEDTGATQAALPDESASRVPSSPPLGGGAASVTSSPTNPRSTLHLKGAKG